MNQRPSPMIAPFPGYTCHLFNAADLYVTSGANTGDGLGGIDDACPGDVYRLATSARPLRMVLAQGRLTVAAGSDIGAPGDPVTLIARYTMMAPDGDMTEVLLLRHVHQAGGVQGTLYALPLSPIAPRRDYALIKAQAAPAAARLGGLLCGAFASGTRITMACGAQRAIQDLRVGDRVLTRDHGAQPLRWIGRATLRASGAFAPVVIGRGALGNSSDLAVSQHHRMLLYQRDCRLGLHTDEVMVQARHLVDGDTIRIRDGGFVEYHSLIFDAHEIIYAEGLCAESLLVNAAMLQHLSDELAREVAAHFTGLDHRPHFGTDLGENGHDALRVGARQASLRAAPDAVDARHAGQPPPPSARDRPPPDLRHHQSP